MFECSACTIRCIRAIAGETLAASRPHPRLLLTPRLALPSQHRRASTAVATASSSNAGNVPYLNAAQLRHQASLKPVIPDEAGAGDVHDFDTSKNENGLTPSAKRALTKELLYLPDPAKLAEHIQYTLRCDNLHKALELVRMASKERSCIVAWNHIVNWHMQRGKVNEALKVFNEMKKRQQFPDSYTYILLLRGLVGRQEKGVKPEISEENAVKAVSIYNSMVSPTSRVQPTIMHTNAALKVCTFARDLDAFWGIAARIPDHGPGAADCITYSIILNAIRYGVLPEGRIHGDDMAQGAQMLEGRRNAVEEGKKVWREVIAKWRSGQVKIDEELVCAMGRVLMMSDRLADWDDVLSLVQQTMQVERLVAPVGSEERRIAHVPGQGQHMEKDEIEEQDEDSELSAEDQQEHDGFKDAPTAKTFNAVKPLPADPAKPNRPTSLIYVTPGNDTLSVLLEACTLMRAPKTASAYWDSLTTQDGLKPDLRNFHAQLRLLMKNRASGKAARLIKEELKHASVQAKPVTFRLAMKTCQRDNKNDGALGNATVVIDVMEATLSDPDLPTLQQYLSLGLATDSGPKVVEMLNRLDSIVHNLRSRVLYGADTKLMSPEYHRHDKTDTIRFFQALVGAIDTLMNRGLVPREDFKHWHARRSQLDTFIKRRNSGNAVGMREMSKDGAGVESKGAGAAWGREGPTGLAHMKLPLLGKSGARAPLAREERSASREARTGSGESVPAADGAQEGRYRQREEGAGRAFRKYGSVHPVGGAKPFIRRTNGSRELRSFRKGRGGVAVKGGADGNGDGGGGGWGKDFERKDAGGGGDGRGSGEKAQRREYGGSGANGGVPWGVVDGRGFANSPADFGM
ncbi:hypothetical protein LTR85_002951 [Meristemomyces frigidus]|nr:hypothetical protein LTR85_002951 [Meristemomyces frigidus]